MIQQILTFIATIAIAAAVGAADELGDAVRTAVAQVESSMVRIQIVGHPDRAGKIVSRVTTGVAVSDAGEIVSSSFGFGGEAASVFIRTADGERYGAEVVATDHVRKLVLLQTDAPGLVPPAWVDDSPPVGAWAIAAGRFYPTPRPATSLGIISALNRVNGLAIQTDAKVSPVNYGGPLLTMDGTVAGILVPLAPGNDATGVAAGVNWYDSGIGFAIPARDVADSVQRLRSGEDRLRGLLGIRPSTQNPLSTDVVVKSVQPQSPAEAAGIQPGDEVVAVNEQSIARVGNLQSALRGSWAGDRIQLTLRRAGQEVSVEATLAGELSVPERGWLGIVPLQTVKSSDSKRVTVRAGILSGYAAERAGLPNPCLISSIDGDSIRSISDVRRGLSRLTAGTDREITIVASADSADGQTLTVTAAARAPGERREQASEVAAIRKSIIPSTLPPWTPSVLDLQDERHAWILGPAEKLSGVETGVVLMLHDGEPETGAMEQEWRDVCQEHQLILAVVYHEYAVPLDSVEVLGEVLARLAQSGRIDPDRVAMVTRDSHAGLVTRVLLDPRAAVLNQAVLLDCRPVTGGAALSALQQKQVSMLLFPPVGDTQVAALTASSVRRLRTAGADVTIRSDRDSLSGRQLASEIARWMLLAKIR